MTIRQVIHSGPAQANELFAKLAETGDGAVKTRERLFAELKAELGLLAGLEERHLLPVLRKHPGTKAVAADALADNKQVRALLAELERMPKDGQDFPGKLAELRQTFQRHVRDEKRELLPAVAKALSEEEARAVAERIEAGKAEAEEAKREAAEKQRAEAKREREAAEAEQAKREEAERRRAEAKRESEEAEKQRAEAKREREEAEAAQAKREEAERQEAEAAERRAREADEAATRPVEAAARGGLRAVEAGAGIAAQSSRQVADAAGQVVEQTATSAASAATRRYRTAASQVLTIEGGLAGFWLELARDQVADNAETLRKLAATRDWREALELQGTLVRDSVGRMSRLNGRCLEAVRAVLAATSSAATDGTDKAA
jgi:DNA repair exonuclease SbcCD ATPase subunit